MPTLGVNTAIFHEGRVLLTKRKDFEVWCLPGGAVDTGETLAEAALRETREEVGLEVKLERLVGVYSRPGWLNGGMHIILFSASILAGELLVQPKEVLEAQFFSPGELPEAILFGHRQRIHDAMNGQYSGVAWLQDGEWPYPPEMTRKDLYSTMESSGLPPADFYFRHVGRTGPRGEQLEVGHHGDQSKEN